MKEVLCHIHNYVLGLKYKQPSFYGVEKVPYSHFKNIISIFLDFPCYKQVCGHAKIVMYAHVISIVMDIFTFGLTLN